MMQFDSVVVRGTGSIGLRHARVLHGLGVAPVAFPVRAGRTSLPDLPAVSCVSSWQEAVAKSLTGNGVRAAVIATDTGRHLEDAHEALSHGYHLLIEKPLSSTIEGVRALVQDANTRGLRVYVACNLRFSKGISIVREHLASLGHLYSARAECQSYLPGWRPGTDHRQGYAARVDEGGVMRDLVHEIDYTLWLAGRPTTVFAVLGNSGELEIASEESADLLWQVPHGATASIRLDYLARNTRRSLTLVGSQGELVWDLVAQKVSVRLAKAETVVVDASQERDGMMTDQARAFLQAAQGLEASTLATLEQGTFAVALMDAARRSSTSHRAETIEKVET